MTTPTPPSIITTIESTVESRKHTSCGVVVAERVLVLRNSGKLHSEEGSEIAMQDIRAQAEALGADAIVEVKIKYEPISGTSSMNLSVWGTAVTFDK